MKFIYISLAIALVVFLYYLISKLKETEVRDELPQRFASYQSIDSLKKIKNGNIQMDLLFESPANIAFFLTPNNDMVISVVAAEAENSFFKLNTTGEVTDSLKLNSKSGDLAFLKGFIINKKTHQYYKWAFNGIKEPNKTVIQNADFAWDTERQSNQLEDILKNSKAAFVDYEFDSPKLEQSKAVGLQTTQGVESYAIITYFIDDDCFQFYTAIDVSKQFPYSYSQKMLWNNPFKRINKKVAAGEAVIKSNNITYQYFQKLKLEDVLFSGGGGGAPSFSKTLYNGYLFTDVAFKTDTLHLKEFMYLDEQWYTSDIEIGGSNIGKLSKNKQQPVEDIRGYMYYTNEKLQYALFSNSDKKIYRIK